MTSGRFYFFRDGRELRDHPCNGSPVAGTGRAVDPAAYSSPRATAWDRRRTAITVWRGRREVRLTVEDFGGQPVLVREWWPDPSARSEFYLVPA